MNITETETAKKATAKVCGCKENSVRKVIYSFLDSYHSMCIDKRDAILAELEACEQLLKYDLDGIDKILQKRSRSSK